ncbi:MAG: ubiquinol-cytochrome C chaperone family protein [Sphingobacteriales bacterium]
MTQRGEPQPPNRSDDISPVSPHAAGHHFDPVWHDRGAGELPCFYREYTVADTVNGRFELLVLHLTMLLDRLAEDLELREFGQALFDRFCTDMDHDLREMGVGDLSVPKQMQRVGGAFYGRAQAYREALAIDGQERLIEARTRNIGSGKGSLDRAATARLAAYMREAVRDLREQPASRFLAGELKLPDPAAIILVEHEADLTEINGKCQKSMECGGGCG